MSIEVIHQIFHILAQEMPFNLNLVPNVIPKQGGVATFGDPEALTIHVTNHCTNQQNYSVQCPIDQPLD